MSLILSTYLLAEIIAPFMASLIVLTTILYLSRLMPILDIFVELGIDFSDFIRLSAYLAPKLMLFTLPMTSMLGVLICFNRLAADNEILALKAGGVGHAKILPPIAVFGLCTALLTGFFSTQLMPAGNVAMKKLLFQLAKEKITKGIRAKSFSEGLGDLVLYVDDIDADTHDWHGVYVSDTRDAQSPLTIVAKTGRLSSRRENMSLTLLLQNGSIHRSFEDITQTISFEEYSLTLSLEGPQIIAGKSATHIDKNGMSQHELLQNARRLGDKNPDATAMRIEFHERLVLAVGCFILTLLAFPLAIQSRPDQKPVSIPLGLMIFVFYYVLLSAGKTMAESGTLPLPLAMWLPNMVYAVITVVLMRLAAKESSIAFIGTIFDWIYGLRAKKNSTGGLEG